MARRPLARAAAARGRAPDAVLACPGSIAEVVAEVVFEPQRRRGAEAQRTQSAPEAPWYKLFHYSLFFSASSAPLRFKSLGLARPPVRIPQLDLLHHPLERIVEIDPFPVGHADEHEDDVGHLHREVAVGL